MRNTKYRYYRRRRYSSTQSSPVEFVIGVVVLLLTAVLFLVFKNITTIALVIGGLLFLAIAGVAVVAVLFWRQQREKIRLLTLVNIDKMTGIEFENYLASLLRSRGFNGVRVTVAEGDFGADLIGILGGVKYAIQAKRYNVFQVGVDAIYQVLGGKEYYGCAKTMVVTNNVFTLPARELAKKTGTELVDRKVLEQWIVEFQSTK